MWGPPPTPRLDRNKTSSGTKTNKKSSANNGSSSKFKSNTQEHARTYETDNLISQNEQPNHQYVEASMIHPANKIESIMGEILNEIKDVQESLKYSIVSSSHLQTILSSHESQNIILNSKLVKAEATLRKKSSELVREILNLSSKKAMYDSR